MSCEEDVKQSNDSSKLDIDTLVENNKNSRWILCQLCGSKILKPEVAELVDKEFFLPSMQQKTKVCLDNPEGDILTKHWLVKDMMTFENVGFSHAVKNIKYLTCADCEVGPVGWHNIEDRSAFYIALQRVNHQ